jgi:C-terminal processing protease CtpA/Prc
MPLISATVVKEETSSKLGIAFERISEDKAMTIKLIRDDSLFKGSDLVEGLIVASAAGKDMEGMSPKDCADALREAPGGEEITLVCKGAIATIKKDKKKAFKKDAKIGISFKSTTSAPGKVFLSKINANSKFHGTDVSIGDQVLSINGQPCPANVTAAVGLLTKKGVEGITLVTISPEDEKAVPKAKEEPVEVMEEKKEEEAAPAESEEPAEPKAESAEDETTPEKKSLIDTMFGVCMC